MTERYRIITDEDTVIASGEGIQELLRNYASAIRRVAEGLAEPPPYRAPEWYPKVNHGLIRVERYDEGLWVEVTEPLP